MTREEAIKYWEGLRKTFSSQLEKEENYFGRMHLQTTIDALDMAISALRQQETVTDSHQLNEPLTLDELRRMEGQPVYIVENTEYWAIVNSFDQAGVYLLSCGNPDDYGYFGFYGKTWLAYRQKPEEDDHDGRKENENV